MALQRAPITAICAALVCMVLLSCHLPRGGGPQIGASTNGVGHDCIPASAARRLLSVVSTRDTIADVQEVVYLRRNDCVLLALAVSLGKAGEPGLYHNSFLLRSEPDEDDWSRAEVFYIAGGEALGLDELLRCDWADIARMTIPVK